MKNFQLVAKCPEVVGAVVSDPAGALVEFSGSVDAENTGAVLTYTSQSLGKAGEQLGLGPLVRAVLTGPTKACILTVVQDGLLGVYVDATKPLGAFEKKMDEILQR